MIELAKHIEILLLDNDCVIVPDFGGFMAHHVDAVYDTEEGLFLPPRRTLGFNPQLYINDSLLAQSYVEAYDLSYPDAIQRIESEVREIRQTLNQEGFYELPDIGIIRQNGDDNYDFEPCPSGILTPSIYALNSFEMPLLSAKGPALELSQKEENAGTVQSRKAKARKKWNGLMRIPKTNRQTPVVSEEGLEENAAIVLSIDAVMLRNIVAAAVVMLLVVFSYIPLGEAVPTNIQQCSIDSNIFSTILTKVKVEPADKLEMIKVVNNTVVNAERSSSEDSIMNEIDDSQADMETYVIVLASKVTKRNGEMLAERLSSDGLKDVRVIERKGGNKVVAGNYRTEQEAYTASRELRNTSSQFEDVWIMKLD